MQYKSVFSERIAAHIDLRSLPGALSDRLRLTCLFGSFAFLQFVVLGLANHAGEGYLATGQREFVYYALQVFVILGFLLHAVYVRHHTANPKGSGIRKGITYAVFGFFFACTAVMLFAGYDSMFYVIVSMAAAFCIGLVGGAAHYRMSLETVTGASVAKSMGIGSAAAVVLQYLLQIRQGISPLLPVFMLAAFLLFGYLVLGKEPEAIAEAAEKAEHTPPKRIVLTILITVMFVLFACFYNEYIHHLQIQSDYGAYNVYSWPRLMLVPGYLLFAVIGDRKNGRYVPIASLCIMLVALLNVVLIGNPEAQGLNMCLFYCSIAGCTSYYLLTFWRLAPGTKRPALWAPFGRIIDSGMVLLAGAIQFSSLPPAVILGLDIAGVALIIFMMAASENFNFNDPLVRKPDEPAASVCDPHTGTPDTTAGDPLPAAHAMQVSLHILSEEEALDRMQKQYDLTPREAEVLRELVLTEDKQAVISEHLNITVKTLQAYVTRLYRKTGTATRAGLTDLYYGNRTKT